MSEHVTAWTALEPRPPYINFSREPDGSMTVLMRSKAKGMEAYGSLAQITIPREVWEAIMKDLNSAP